MSYPLYVAFIWHHHQPLYKNREGKYHLPWVRLHATKDYLDLVLLLEQYPKLHQTVNLVPSLILQLEDYAAGKAFDPYLAVALQSVESLTVEQKQFVIDRFFDAHHRTLIDPHPRYSELFEQKQEHGREWCFDHWQVQDYSDLMMWHNLAWIDPLFWDDREIAAWLEQGTGFRLSDRQRLYAKQQEIIRRIIPQHRQMQDRGQLEITTTPYTHPILPLLADTQAGQVAVPDLQLPDLRFEWSEDIPRHLSRAKQMYRERFGRDPRGLWPSEQAVSPAILPEIAAQGFTWICTDEAILGWTINHFFHRDGSGTVQQPELLYRPYRLETNYGNLAVVFRDHRLSDLIGFSYGNMEPRRAATDLVGQLEAIIRTLKSHQQQTGGSALEQPWLVTIALDGENCWEAYAQDGKPFLEHLYRILSEHPMLELVTVSEFIDRFPPALSLPAHKLHSGSWVDGSFTTWIGDPSKNRAWDLLTQARQTLARHPEASEETNPDAWEALFAAEGSDWFWWFGEGHTSNQDDVFDRLFREHLASLYRALNEPIPPELQQAIEDHSQTSFTQTDRLPMSFIHPVIDGHGDEQDWDRAGRIEIGGARGTMHRNSPVQRIWYGLDHSHFYVRLDFQRDRQPGVNLASELHLLWFYPDRAMAVSPAPIAELPDQAPLNYCFRHHLGIHLLTQSHWFQEAGAFYQWQARLSRAQVALNSCLEIAIPWADLPIAEPDWSLRLLVILADDGRYVDYLPENQLLLLNVP
ncbi:MAG: glycoside hydrolase [Elainella sp. Prado103]|jgi:alpha-amylase/alpha-mannosidase (GH57 family)|nr:glycoside hydrolase [Elainella sp. Prado103]